MNYSTLLLDFLHLETSIASGQDSCLKSRLHECRGVGTTQHFQCRLPVPTDSEELDVSRSRTMPSDCWSRLPLKLWNVASCAASLPGQGGLVWDW